MQFLFYTYTSQREASHSFIFIPDWCSHTAPEYRKVKIYSSLVSQDLSSIFISHDVFWHQTDYQDKKVICLLQTLVYFGGKTGFGKQGGSLFYLLYLHYYLFSLGPAPRLGRVMVLMCVCVCMSVCVCPPTRIHS